MYAKKKNKPTYGKGGMAKMVSKYVDGGKVKYRKGGKFPDLKGRGVKNN